MSDIKCPFPILTYQHRKNGSVVNAIRVKKNNWEQVADWVQQVLEDSGKDFYATVTSFDAQQMSVELDGRWFAIAPEYTIILDDDGIVYDCTSNSSMYRHYRTCKWAPPVPQVEIASADDCEVKRYSRPALEWVEAVQHVGDNLPQILGWATESSKDWPGLRVFRDVISVDTPQGPRKLEYGDYLVLSNHGEWQILTSDEMHRMYTRGKAALGGSVGTSLDTMLELQAKIESQWGRMPNSKDPENVSTYVRQVVLCLEDELHEALAHVHWKPWKTSRGFKDVYQYRAELADVLHFVLDLYLAAGLTGADIYQDYLAKHKENISRRSSKEYVES